MEMMVMEAICFLRQISSKTLLEESDFAKVNSVEFIKEFQKKKELKTIKKNIIEYLKEKSEEDLVLINADKYVGKRYGISSKTFSDINQYEKIVKLIHEIGGVFTAKKEVTEFLIVKNDEDLDLLHKILNDSFGGEIILLDVFYKKI